MKRILILGFSLFLIACSQSEMDKLKSDQENLKKQVAELNKQAEPLSAECQKKLAIYQEAVTKNSPDIEEKKASGAKICQQAFDIENKALELQAEVVNINLAMIEEDSKKNK